MNARVRSKIFMLCLIGIVIALHSDAQQVNNNKSGILREDSLVLPFHLVDGFIFIEAEVNGVKGKLMFDTGTPFEFLLNNHRIVLQKKDTLKIAKAGSGQRFIVYNQEILDSLKLLNRLSIRNLKNVKNADFSFIEDGITGDFLGFIGNPFFKNFEFLLDYEHQIIKLYRLDKSGQSAVRHNGLKKIASANYQGAKDFSINHLPLDATFDTGNQGEITLTTGSKKTLLQTRYLQLYNTGHRYGKVDSAALFYSVNHLTYEGISFSADNLSEQTGPKNAVVIGYAFLKRFITIWNYDKKTITFYTRL